MCLAQGPQRSDAGEARTCGPSVSSQETTIKKVQYNLEGKYGIPHFEGECL